MGAHIHHVKLTEFEHQGHSCFRIEFEFDTPLKELIKSIKEIAWSARRKTLYVPKNKLTLHQLYTHLNVQSIYVDYTHLKTSIKTKKKASTKRIPRTISDKKKEVIRAFVNCLRNLRLSDNNIRVSFTLS
jgi:HJR/Mrr/RecB family endonuclease